jgi:hypothetical protein
MKLAGNQWLRSHYNLSDFSLTHCSYIGSNDSVKLTSKGTIEQVYGPKYAPVSDTVLLHLEFALKYDDLNLDFLKSLFDYIEIQQLVDFIESSPSGKYSRIIGFLYEFLTGKSLDITKPIVGNYVDILDPKKYITGNTVKITRWHVNNNLLGTASFCPIVRRTKILDELLSQNIAHKIEQLRKGFPEEIFSRAINYLYTKETRSSYAIEKEDPSVDRMSRFINLLQEAGKQPIDRLLDQERLILLQNAIVDPRFTAVAFRNFQNYIGQILPNFQELIHYICPTPQILPSLMQGLKDTFVKTSGIYSEIRAAIISFGFVFIHPFEDGNGRLHRFLIHDILVSDRVVPLGLIIPVSAHMLGNLRDYDNLLEKYSKPLMQRIRYTKSDSGEIQVTNGDKVEGYFRYPDLTEHCIYLAQTIHATLENDMPDELVFMLRYDEVKKALQYIVDMPDRDINLMIMFLHQNAGIFPKRRRQLFAKLTDQEISAMQAQFRLTFELDEYI